jgi:hypothetical protein
MKSRLIPSVFAVAILLVATFSVASAQGAQGARGSNENKAGNNAVGANSNAQITTEAHRSTVTSFVQSLTNVADRDAGIGEQVRTIARTQNESATTTLQAMERIQTRNQLKTLLIGNDYKNLGVLRSEMVKTQNNLGKLNTLLSSTTDSTIRAELTEQINVLTAEQTKINDFVNANEKSFSILGWFTRLFIK